jgi:hypothetical protein
MIHPEDQKDVVATLIATHEKTVAALEMAKKTSSRKRPSRAKSTGRATPTKKENTSRKKK